MKINYMYIKQTNCNNLKTISLNIIYILVFVLTNYYTFYTFEFYCLTFFFQYFL